MKKILISWAQFWSTFALFLLNQLMIYLLYFLFSLASVIEQWYQGMQKDIEITVEYDVASLSLLIKEKTGVEAFMNDKLT